ncbi:MAG: condensation domain-containing protein [Cyanobacteria bacterium P01_H01_bin.35]
MNLNQILSEVSKQGIKLWAEGDELKIRAPKGSLTPELKNLLSENKANLLELLQKNNTPSVDSVPLVPVSRDRNLPVSYQQERLWTVSQLMANSAALNLCHGLRIEGVIDIDKWQESLNEMVRRYETLRTKFTFVEGSLVQVIIPDLEVKLLVEKYQGLSETEKEVVIKEQVEKELSKAFDVSQAPLFVVKIVQFSDKEAVLISVFNHIITDGFSQNLFSEEILKLYDIALEEKPFPASELEVQYVDYAVWQREYLQGEVLQKGLNYWQKQLADIATLYPVPNDRFQSKNSVFRGTQKYFKLPEATGSLVQEFSNQNNITPVVFFLSVFYVLIQQYSRQKDIVLGFPVSGRSHDKIQSAIGFFADIILLRADNIEDSLTFKDLLYKVKEITINAYANQHIPLNYITEFVKPQSYQEYRNLFQLFFDYIDVGENTAKYSNFTTSSIEEKLPADIDLFFTLVKVHGELKGSWTYNAELFEPETIAELIASYLSILEKGLQSPDTPICEFKLSEKLELHKTKIHSPYAQKELVETALKSIPEIQECAIISRENQQVAYVVVSKPLPTEKIKSALLQSSLSPQLLPSAYVPISSLPQTASGELDEAALAKLEVIDADLIARWEEKLRSQAEIEDVAVVVQGKQVYSSVESDQVNNKEATENLKALDVLPCEVDEIAASTPFESWADLLPGTDNPAILGTDARQPLTHAQLKEFVQSPPDNASLSHLGIKISDRVCAAIPNGPEAAVAFLSLAQQCVFAPISTSLTEKQVIFELEDLGVVALILQKSEANNSENEKLKACAESVGVRVIELIPDPAISGLFTLEEITKNKDSEIKPVEVVKPNRDNVALVLHTSGTTRKPKTVPLTHGNLTAGSLTISKTIALTTEDTCINVMPLFHIHGLSVNILASLLAGATVLCTPGLYAGENGVEDFFKWLKADAANGRTVTWYSAVPTMHQVILEYAEQAIATNGTSPTHSLRLIRNCSAALLPAIAERMASTFNCEVLPTYAMTESMPICSPEIGKGLAKSGSVGRAAGPQLIIGEVQENGGGKPTLNVLPPYSEGEVMVRGACVTSGYELRDWMDYNPNEEAFIEGWLRTGDKGYMDKDSYVYLVGRFKEIINRAGEKISPMLIEDILQRHPAVGQVVVFAAPHELLGEVVGAAIVPVADQPKPTLAALRQFAMKEKELELQWLPECLVWMSAIPKGLTGKPARIGLAKRLGLPVIPADGANIPRSFVATEPEGGKFVLEIVDSPGDWIGNGQGDCQSLQYLSVYFTTKTTDFSISKWQDLEVSDRFGTPSKIMASAFVKLEALPLTSDGKIDRKKLLEPEKNNNGSQVIQAGNETEQKIAAIWREVLQIEEVGIYDNFFELGGKSILLVQVYSKLKEIFDINLKVLDLLSYPTVNSLAQYIAGDGEVKSNEKNQASYEKRLNKRLSKNDRGNVRKKLRSRK